MVIDTSALVAIVYAEPDHLTLAEAIARDDVRLITAASALEAAVVMMRRAGGVRAGQVLALLDETVEGLDLTIEPVTASQSAVARDAYRRYGKGFHAAGLNFGDCFAYALAKETGEPLLFKGADFAQTDIASCL